MSGPAGAKRHWEQSDPEDPDGTDVLAGIYRKLVFENINISGIIV